MEKELTGLYISGSPLEDYTDYINEYRTISSEDFTSDSGEDLDSLDNTYGVVVGIIDKRQDKRTKNGELMTFINLDDGLGEIELIVFPKDFIKYRNILLEDEVIMVKGNINVKENENPKIIAQYIEKAKENEKTLYIQLEDSGDIFDRVKEIFKRHPGKSKSVIYFKDIKKYIQSKKNLYVSIDDDFQKELSNLIGEKTYILNKKGKYENNRGFD